MTFSLAWVVAPHLRADSRACPGKTSSSQASAPCSSHRLFGCLVEGLLCVHQGPAGCPQACPLANSKCVWELLAGGFSPAPSALVTHTPSLGSLPALLCLPLPGPGCPPLSLSPRCWVLTRWLPCFQKVVIDQHVPPEEGPGWEGAHTHTHALAPLS